ncbi:MAG: thioredoxin family protein [Cyanobacteria bacterium REEB67]|nr:thioredoxin family protein [Cyanobacteria bacterium REEB67]
MSRGKLGSGQHLHVALLATLIVAWANAPATFAQAKKASAHPVAVASAPAAPTSISWSNDLRVGLAQAKSARRWVLVDCYTSWCHWCKKLDADVFENPNVIKQLGGHFTWVKCNTEDPQTGVWVRDKYGVDAYPCILILDPNGNEKGRIKGYVPPDLFINRVASIVTR